MELWIYQGILRWRFRGVSTACLPPLTGRAASCRLHFVFVSSSFLFRACRACRACGRSEAEWAHDHRCPCRWASRERVSTCVRADFRFVCDIVCKAFYRSFEFFFEFLCARVCFQELAVFLYGSTVLGEFDLKIMPRKINTSFCECQHFHLWFIFQCFSADLQQN